MNQDQRTKQFSQLIAKTWADVGFKQRLLSDTVATLKAEGWKIEPSLSIHAVENTDTLINLILPPKPTGDGAEELIANVAAGPKVLAGPTLSNVLFPIPGCGKAIAKAWNDVAFKQQFLSDPAAALKAAGVTVPAGVAVKSAENSAHVLHLVLPLKPSDELSDEQLDGVAGGAGVPGPVIAKPGRPQPPPVGFGCACACCCSCICCC